jgi:dipeptidyl aminopeptidase/acylaminoacyl peptidase
MSAQIAMFQHAAGSEVRDVIDLDSYLAYYDVNARTVKTTPALARKERLETYPAWSPDGRFLYFCSAPKTWTDRNVIPAQYDQVQYDLMRIAYDVQRDAWGTTETVLSAQDTGQSILEPRISPDGRWLLFCMCKYGCFPVYQQSSDLYLIDLEAAGRTGRCEYRRLEVNSDESESWHSWSSNSRWIAFSSKRDNGTFTRTYLSYVDPNGTAHKPLLLPQEDPTHYDSCLWTYSVPELVTEPVQVSKEGLGRVVRGSRQVNIEMPVTMATPRTKPEAASDPYRSTRE